MSLKLHIFHQSVPLAKLFRISRGAKSTAEVIVAVLTDGEYYGWGEAVPYARYKESIASVSQQLQEVKKRIDDSNIGHTDLLKLLEPGSAKNALDCAMWDLRTKQEGKAIYELANLPAPVSCITAQTLSVDSAEVMQKEALNLADAPLIKIKLDAEHVVDKMHAIFEVCPKSQFIVDANEGWTMEVLKQVCTPLKDMNVVLIEQPLLATNDSLLKGFDCPIPLCADESCHTSEHLDELQASFQQINIKLDKTGGLSSAITLMHEARKREMGVMIGCMVGTSLGMSPAFSLCSQANFVDLDGPLLVAQDRPNGFLFNQGEMSMGSSHLWGTPDQSSSFEQIQALFTNE